MSDGDLEPITSEEDILRTITTALEKRVEVYCDFKGLELPFVIRAIHYPHVVLGIWTQTGEAPTLLYTVLGQNLKEGQKLEAIFTLPDGQYGINSPVSNVTLSSFTLSADKTLVRLQRRRDFRAYVRPFGVRFEWAKTGEKKPISLDVIDLSAGGMRIFWPASLGEPSNQLLTGSLQLIEGKTADVQARFVRNFGKQGADPKAPYSVAYQFKDLSQETARSLLFTCMTCQRKMFSPE